jgi:rod shape-determining protein MreC
LSRRKDTAVTASIVSRSIGSEASTFVIDRGTDDGISVGLPAISGDGILIGKVVAASQGSATVRVISDRDSATAVTLLNGTRTIGVANGISGALLSLRYIPQDELIETNDIVVTSGLETSVPSGLIVGIVNEVVTDPTAPFQSAVLEPLGDPRRLAVDSVLHPESQ